MKKLSKKRGFLEATMEAYACRCGCVPICYGCGSVCGGSSMAQNGYGNSYIANPTSEYLLDQKGVAAIFGL